MAEHFSVPFAALLRRLRTEAGMTQEELAEAAGLSPRSVSDLERGINLTARRETARLLADALQLTGPARAEFEVAARRRPAVGDAGVPAGVAGGIAVAMRTLPRDVASFTGREADLRWLMNTAACSGGTVDVYAIGGMAGIGKTTFAVHAAHLLAPRFPDGQIFLPLHGHTPGQHPVDPADALASLLQTAGVAADRVPQGLEARARLWRGYLAGRRLLIVLDDAIGHDQVRPLLPGTDGSLVLITSRRHLAALEDAQTISLDTLTPEEATQLLIRLAARPGLDRDDPAVGEITRLCGYLPLAIGMLARQLHHHPAWSAAGLAAELAAARDRLELMHAENLSVAAAFDLSYHDLTADQQRMFRRLGVHPGTDVDGYAAAALDGTSLTRARRLLEALYDQHLLTEPARGRYRLHDLIREHARTRGSADSAADRDQAARRLLDYYLHTARAASLRLVRRPPASAPPVAGTPPAHAPDLPARDDADAWMDAERFNLHAAATFARAHGLPRYTTTIAAAMHGFLRARNYWDQALSLHRMALGTARDASDRHAEARALDDLGDTLYLTMAYPQAITSFAQALSVCRELGDRRGEASVLSTLGNVQQTIGNTPAAAASQEQSLNLYRELGDHLGQAAALNRLGWVRSTTGDHLAAAACQHQALHLYREASDPLGEASALSSIGGLHRDTGDHPAASAALAQALALYRHLGNRIGEANTLTDLASVQRATGDYQTAAANLTQALAAHRDIGSRLGEAGTLAESGRLHNAIGDYPAAAADLTRALTLYQDLGIQGRQAYVLNALGDLTLAIGTTIDARTRFEQALAIATKAGALGDQAHALEGIGRCHRHDGHADDSAISLHHALAIYQQIGSPRAGQLQRTFTTKDQTRSHHEHPE